MHAVLCGGDGRLVGAVVGDGWRSATGVELQNQELLG